eukprot:TRINITY_DN24207_c0_g2_i1.p1 TRINITY_DN24207_c0_g2~~TRINITY_DN24207_c0_g2_i1.p1  ORF type:complete len:101 (+),score=17.15 TRINITY_DN24207_c0_g2_i1:149-451(+)
MMGEFLELRARIDTDRLQDAQQLWFMHVHELSRVQAGPVPGPPPQPGPAPGPPPQAGPAPGPPPQPGPAPGPTPRDADESSSSSDGGSPRGTVRRNPRGD